MRACVRACVAFGFYIEMIGDFKVALYMRRLSLSSGLFLIFGCKCMYQIYFGEEGEGVDEV